MARFLRSVVVIVVGLIVAAQAYYSCDGVPFFQPDASLNSILYDYEGKNMRPDVKCVSQFGGTCMNGGNFTLVGCNCTCVCPPGWGGMICNETMVHGAPTTSHKFGLAASLLRYHGAAGMKMRKAFGNETTAWANAFSGSQMTIEMWVTVSYNSDPFGFFSDFSLIEATPSILKEPDVSYHHRFMVGYSDRKWFVHGDVSSTPGSREVVYKTVLKSFADGVLAMPLHLTFVWHNAARAFSSGGDDDSQWLIYIDGLLQDMTLQYGRFEKPEEIELAFGTLKGTTNNKNFPTQIRFDPPEETRNIAIDDLRIWNKARSQYEIMRDMHNPLVGNEPNLVGYYTFDEADDYEIPNHAAGFLNLFPLIRYHSDSNPAPSEPVRYGNTSTNYKFIQDNWSADFYPSHTLSFVPGPTDLSTTLYQVGSNIFGDGPVDYFGMTANLVGSKVWLIGGSAQHVFSVTIVPVGSGTVFTYDPATNTYARQTIANPNGATVPTQMLMHSTTLIDDKRILILGGSIDDPLIAVLNTETVAWEPVNCPGWTNLGTRSGHVTVFLKGIAYVFGGVSNLGDQQLVTELIAINTTDWSTRVIPAPVEIVSRFLHFGYAVDENNIVVSGGIDALNQPAKTDLWIFNINSEEFIQTDAVIPSKIWPTAAQVGDTLFLYGGMVGTSVNTLLIEKNTNLGSTSEDRKTLIWVGERVTLNNTVTDATEDPNNVKVRFTNLPPGTFVDSPRTVRFAAASVYYGGWVYIFGGINHVPCIDERGIAADVIRPTDPVLMFRVGCAPGYVTVADGSCSACAPGTYQPLKFQSGLTQCVECPFGTYSTASASEYCLNCPSDSSFSAENVARDSRASCTPASSGVIAAAVLVPLLVVAALGGVGGYFGYKRYKKSQARVNELQKARPQKDLNIDQSQFSSILWIRHTDIEIGDLLGEGSFGSVYKATYKGREVACKISKPGIETGVVEFLKEAEVMMTIKPHPNVMQLLGVCLAGGSAMVVLEFARKGSLKSLVEDGFSFSENDLKALLLQIARGLKHIHEHNLIHRDLACRNILLDEDEKGKYLPKISDFGMSRIVDAEEQAGKTASTFGPVPWMAPEAISDLQYSTASDIWSLGITFWEVCTGQDPSKEADLVTLAVKIRDNGFHPRIPPFATVWLTEILNGCWHKSAHDRITIDEIIRILEGGKIDVATAKTAFSGASNTNFDNKAVGNREHAGSNAPAVEVERLRKQNAELEATVRYMLVRMNRNNGGGEEITLKSIMSDLMAEKALSDKKAAGGWRRVTKQEDAAAVSKALADGHEPAKENYMNFGPAAPGPASDDRYMEMANIGKPEEAAVDKAEAVKPPADAGPPKKKNTGSKKKKTGAKKSPKAE